MIGCVETTYLKKITTLLFINSSTSTSLIENITNVLIDEMKVKKDLLQINYSFLGIAL
ncbi:hypothetical protein FVB9288_03125 [Flavobacterium sp. CECT 9288]|nr:hypothetical protein FVB9288_03125 [Flavobacterium sp. CECT 9288]